MATRTPEKQFRNFWIFVFGGSAIFAAATLTVIKDPLFIQAVGSLLSNFWWIFLPVPIFIMFMESWTEYNDYKWLASQSYVLMEIIPPSDVERNPKIMEQLFNGLHTHSTPNRFELYCGWRPLQGRFSFEMVSHQGDIHFYTRCPIPSRNNVEAQIYAQYPDAELFEVEDYTKEIPKVMPNRDWDLWGSVISLKKDEQLPIRTYPYFHDDVTGKVIDPIASLAEVMSSVGKDEYVWYQIVFTPEKDTVWKPKCDIYIDEITKKAQVKKNGFWGGLFGEIAVVPGNFFRGLSGEDLTAPGGGPEEDPFEFNINKLTPGEQERLKAISENTSRPAFLSLIRFVYLAKKESFNKAHGVAGVMATTKQFSDVNLNVLGTDNRTKTFANYYFTGARLAYRQRKIVEDYRSRAYAGSLYLLHTDELATLFHFPDMEVRAPSITRIETKKSDAPVDLPIDVDFKPS